MLNFISSVREIYETPEGFIPLHDPRFIGNERNMSMDDVENVMELSADKTVSRLMPWKALKTQWESCYCQKPKL